MLPRTFRQVQTWSYPIDAASAGHHKLWYELIRGLFIIFTLLTGIGWIAVFDPLTVRDILMLFMYPVLDLRPKEYKWTFWSKIAGSRNMYCAHVCHAHNMHWVCIVDESEDEIFDTLYKLYRYLPTIRLANILRINKTIVLQKEKFHTSYNKITSTKITT